MASFLKPPPLPHRGFRGYTLLAVLVILAALGLIVFATLQYALSEQKNSLIVRDDAFALTIAETGLERTKAYLEAINTTFPDLDLALDPLNDSTCLVTANGVQITGNNADDFLPVFTDGLAVVVPPSNKRYMRVPNQGGAYLVRIEDNDDDAEPGMAASTNNNLGGGGLCQEGPAVRQNPARDRDRTVIVTVIGIYPGTNFNQARARKSLRMVVGPAAAQGISAGGPVTFNGASHVCGTYGDLTTTSDINGGCLCGAGCSAGPPFQSCGVGNVCNAQAGGACNSVTFGGAAGTCAAGAAPPPPPRVSAWDAANAPSTCTAANCLPFYYLRPGGGSPLVYMWDYSKTGLAGTVPNCNNPKAWGRICHPTDAATVDLAACATCWTVQPAVVTATSVLMADAPTLDTVPPVATVGPLVWTWNGANGGIAGAAGCDALDSGAALYPGVVAGLGSAEVPNAVFTFKATSGALFPHGVWFVEGNIKSQADTKDCLMLVGFPTWTASLIATGDISVQGNMLALRPATAKSYILLAGRDFEMNTGNTQVWACGTGAVLVHEQMSMGANDHFTAQLIVESNTTCSAAVAGDAITLQGNATIEVPFPPPVPNGRFSTTLSWAESSN